MPNKINTVKLKKIPSMCFKIDDQVIFGLKILYISNNLIFVLIYSIEY